MEPFLVFGVFGGITCLTAAAAYVSARTSDKDAEILKSVTRVNQLKDLAQLLDAEKLPLVVSISGEVASETPIKCKISSLSGVIVDESVEEHYLKKLVERKEKCECAIEHKKTCNYAHSFFDKNDVFSWTQHSRLISSIPKEVPWYLDDGTDRVHVVGARGATDFVLPTEGSKFDPSEISSYLEDEKILGLKRIERVLLVGTSLNVVGEASKDDDGTVRIQRPLKGPFYVSGKTIDEHIANFVDYARYCKINSAALGMIGACMLATSIVIIILEGGVALKCEKDSQVAQ